MTEAFKVLRYELIADDGSGTGLIQSPCQGREFETAEGLEAEGLIRARVHARRVGGDEGACAARSTRHYLADQHKRRNLVDGRRPHFPAVKRLWSRFLDEWAPTAGSA